MKSQPIRLDIDYVPIHDRRSVALRFIFALPAWFLLALLLGPGPVVPRDWLDWLFLGLGGLVPSFPLALAMATALTLIFGRRYPRWWFDFHVELVRFGVRVIAYLCLLTDRYPAIEEEHDVRVAIEYPGAATDRPRWFPAVKWLLATPHYIALYTLWIAAIYAALFAWIWILFTRRYPETLFEFVTGVFRWSLNVYAYAFLLVTDDYPPFRLKQTEAKPVPELVEW